MKLSLKWLSEFFPNLKPDLFAHSEMLRRELPLSGLEIGACVRLGAGLEEMRIAQILEFQKHPNADKLNVCRVLVEQGQDPLQIVCGAPNVKAGAKVALAPVGCTLPNGLKIKQAAIRGVDSSGMLCSEKELGLSEASEGILLLPDTAPVGSSLVKSLGLNDEVWEVELTPDRADCLSHLGMAREVARWVDAHPVLPEMETLNSQDSSDVPLLSVEVSAHKACPLYGAQLFEGVSHLDTPDWMRRTLERIGQRSHNAMVDITNFVLMELGHPLHAFDADQLVGSKILVRFAKNGEKLVTLDGIERVLTAEDLVIADAEKPVALAGVMGGLESGVTEKTRRVVLESAIFDMNVIRAMARRHKIHSEASHRFERGVDPQGCMRSAGRASLLIRQITGARRRGSYVEVRSEKDAAWMQPGSLNFNLRSFKDVTGLEVTPEDIIAAFQKVGIEASTKSANVLKVTIPTHRLDLLREIDLIEEGARLLGYGHIPERYPEQTQRSLARTGSLYRALRQLRHRMVDTGLSEMMPYAFFSEARREWVPGAPLVELANPLSMDWKYLRPHLTVGLLDVVARHVGLGQMAGRYFDMGAVFERAPQKDVERSTQTREAWHMGWCLQGPRQMLHWSSDKKSADRKAEVDYFDAKGILESLVPGLSIFEGRWNAVAYTPLSRFLAEEKLQEALAQQAPWIPVPVLHPGRTAILTLPGRPPGEIVGFVGELHPAFKRDILNLPAGLQLGVSLGEIRVLPDVGLALQNFQERLAPRAKITPSRRLPVVERDLALVVSSETPAGEMDKAFRKALGKSLLDVSCVDRFELPDGRLSLAWRFWLQGEDKTFTDAEIAELMKQAQGEVAKKFQAELRGS